MSGMPLILTAAIHGSLLLLMALLVVRVVPGLSAADRHAILVAALLGQCLLVLVWFTPIGVWSVPGGERLPESVRHVLLPGSGGGGADEWAAPEGDAAGPMAVASPAEPESRSAGVLLIVLWAAGWLILSWRVAMGHIWARGVVARAQEYPDDNRVVDFVRRTRVLLSSETGVPFTYGLVRPVVVLPRAAARWSEKRRRMVLEHESEHVRRRDPAWSTVVELVRALFWPNPVVWWVGLRARAEAEMAADDAVIRSGGDPGRYVHELVDLVRGGQPRVPATLPALTSRFESRVMALLEGDALRTRLRVRRTGPLMAALLGAMVLMTTASATEWQRWALLDGDRLRLLQGAVVEVEGRGALRFDDGRTSIRLGSDLRLEGGIHPEGALPADSLILAGSGDGQWVLRPVQRIPSGPGSRIIDSGGSGTAAVESERSIRFYIEVQERGRTVFFHPESP